jgi:hypothetical protein
MPSRSTAGPRVVLAGLLGLALLAHPLVLGGPGPVTEYEYTATDLELTDDESVETLYHLPGVTYGRGPDTEAVRAADEEPFVRPVTALDPAVRNLTGSRFLADDPGDRYYRVDARADGETFRLNASVVPAEAVAQAFAVDPGNASAIVRDVLAGRLQHARQVPPAVVHRGGTDYTLVRVTDTVRVQDPLAIPKLAAFGAGLAALVWVGVTLRN